MSMEAAFATYATKRIALWITTRSDEDRAEQIAVLTAAGEYAPDRLVIEWRIVRPKGFDRELHRPSPSPLAH